jgi:hypothetical protein
MSYFLEISDNDIATLNDQDLRSLIGHLCEAEYLKHGLSTKVVQWGGHQDAPDGGIDILIKSDSHLPADSYIPKAHTIFQSKVTNMTSALIHKEMSPSGSLRDSIVNLAVNQGAYIIVSSHSITAKEYNLRINEMKKAIGNLDIAVDYYHGGRIASWAKEHASIILWVRQRSKRLIYGWKSYIDWAGALGIDKEYILDEGCRLVDKRAGKRQELSIPDGISEIRKLLSQSGNYVRITGLSGVGKTRLAQALFDKKIGGNFLNESNVIYTDIADEPTPSPQNIAEQIIARGSPTILIIDNCSPELHRSLVKIFKHKLHSTSLLTIEYDVADDLPEETGVFHLEPSSDQVIAKLISRRFPNITDTNTRKIAEFSGGNARIAIAIAETITPGESIGHLQDNELFKRLFNQRKGENEDLKRSAETLSLVYSFDVDDTVSEESELITLGRMTSVSPEVLYRHAVDLRERDLVQARGRFRAVLPHAIANRLAISALDRLPIDRVNSYLLLKGNERLIRSFTRRLSYIPNNESVKKIVENWLASESGWISDVSNLNELGMSVFENIASVHPELALNAIERAVSRQRKEFANRGNRYFSRFIHLLRHIGYEENLFERSTRVITEFALTENVGENMDSIRSELKSMFQIYLSGTLAPVGVRLRVVEWLWNSDEEDQQQLAIELIESALEAWHFSSHYNPTFGSKLRGYGLEPQFPDSVRNWFTEVVELCLRMLDRQSSLTKNLQKILASKLRGIWTKAHLFDLVEKICQYMTRSGFWGEGWFKVLSIVRYDAKDKHAEFQDRLINLEKSLQPKDLRDRITAYFMSGASGLDIQDVLVDDKGNGFERLFQCYENLGKEMVGNEQILNELTPTLLSFDNSEIFHLGVGMYNAAVNKEEVWNNVLGMYLMIPIQKQKPFLLKGWINGAHRQGEEYSDQILKQALLCPELKQLFLVLQSAIPISQYGFLEIQNLLTNVEMQSKEFKSLSHSIVYSTVSPRDLTDIIKKLINRSQGKEAAFEILYYKCHAVNSGSINDITDELLVIGRELLLDLDLTQELKSQGNFKIRAIMQVCFSGESASDSSSEFAEKLMRIVRRKYIFPDGADGMINILVKIQPICFLNTLLEKGVPCEYVEWIEFSRNFEKYDAYLSTLSSELLLDWCREDPGERYKLLAGAIYSYESTEENLKLRWKPIFWELVQDAPNLIEVLDRIEETLSPSIIYNESRANVYHGRLTLFTSLFDNSNDQLSKWAKLKFDEWNEKIVRCRKFEEERDKGRNESFE